jgi:hypothetical protein
MFRSLPIAESNRVTALDGMNLSDVFSGSSRPVFGHSLGHRIHLSDFCVKHKFSMVSIFFSVMNSHLLKEMLK